MSKIQNPKQTFSVIGVWSLFVIWCLEFGASFCLLAEAT
jgi:membrane protein YqaA with SNARE-associated domain